MRDSPHFQAQVHGREFGGKASKLPVWELWVLSGRGRNRSGHTGGVFHMAACSEDRGQSGSGEAVDTILSSK